MSDTVDCVDGDLRLVGEDSEKKGCCKRALIRDGELSMEMDGLMQTLKSPADNWGSIQKVKLS